MTCRGVVPAAERPGRLGEQGGERAPADPGQGGEDGRVARPAALRVRRLLAQGGAELVELALGLADLAVGQAQPDNEGAEMQDGRFGAATLMAGRRRMARAVPASTLRMRCRLSSRASVASRRRAALAGVGAMVHSARTHSAATSSASSSSCG